MEQLQVNEDEVAAALARIPLAKPILVMKGIVPWPSPAFWVRLETLAATHMAMHCCDMPALT